MIPKPIIAKWQGWETRFNAISRRERLMVSGAAVIGVLMLGSSLFIEPVMLKNQQARKKIVNQTEELAKLRLQVHEMQTKFKVDPSAVQRAEIVRLDERRQGLNAEINSGSSALVAPAEMNAMLERLLGRHPGLRLVSLRSLAPINMMAAAPAQPAAAGQPGAAATAKPQRGLYRHGIEVKIAGSYGDLHQYLSQLEAQGKQLVWGEVRLAVSEYPTAVLTLVVYTLSAEQAWLSI